LSFALLLADLNGQGLYTQFGQKRTASNDYNWQTLSNDLVTIYFYGNGEKVARNALQIITNETKSIEKAIGQSVSSNVIVMLYNNMNEYRQSNVGIQYTPFNPAGNSKIRQNLYPVYFNGDYNYLKKQLRKALSNAILTDLFYGRSVQEKIRSNAGMSLPFWYYEGLLNYLSEPWNVRLDDLLRDKIEHGAFDNFNNLSREDQLLAGHSLWYYIQLQYGKDKITSAIFWTQYENDGESALMRISGITIGRLLKNWKAFFTKRYSSENRLGSMPKGTEKSPEKIAKYKHTRFVMSPNGRSLAIVTNNKGLVKVWVYNMRTQKTNLIRRFGYKSPTLIPDNYYPIIGWHPEGRKLGIISYIKGEERLEEVSVRSGKTKVYNLGKHNGISDFCYSLEGDSVVISAFDEGQSDLYLVDLTNEKVTQLTNDLYLDVNPSIHPNGSILFASRRPSSSRKEENILEVADYPLTIFSRTSNGKITQIGKPLFGANYYSPLYYGNGLITCLTDETGIINAAIAAENKKEKFTLVSSYKRSVLYQDIAWVSQELAELVLNNGKYYIYISELSETVLSESELLKPVKTSYRLTNPVGFAPENTNIIETEVLNESQGDDSIGQKDTLKEIKQDPYFLSNYPVIDHPIETATELINQPVSLLPEGDAPTLFFTNYLLTQADQSNLGFPYFPIEMDSHAMDYSIFSINLAGEVSDLFRNYIARGGFRLHGDLLGYDAYANLDILKYKLDFEVGGMRRVQTYLNGIDYTERAAQSKLWAGVSYPFSERSSLRYKLGFQQDRVVSVLDQSDAINQPNQDRPFLTNKLEYVYDNSLNKGNNRVLGIRAKVFAESFLLLNQDGNVFNIGWDIRNVSHIGKGLLLANRLSGGISPGSKKTIYYLGGIETWINQRYNRELGFNRDPDAVFLTQSPNLRGFNRNISHGWATGVFNTELRYPILASLYKAPLYYEFFKTFTLYSFLDVGSAWNGFNPYTSSNPFNTRTYDFPNYTVSVTSPRNPWLTGTGIGVRASVFGYLLKVERAWGRLDKTWQNGITYFSLGLDF
jgi:hypothetical protein